MKRIENIEEGKIEVLNETDGNEYEIKAAEAASIVRSLPQHLQLKAFEIILAHMLNGKDVYFSRSPRKRSKSVVRSTSKAIAKRTHVENFVPTVELNVEQFDQLKVYFSAHSPKGTEMAVFTIAGFIVQSLNKESFNRADIYQCYRRLITVGAKPPIIKGEGDVQRAIHWLAAPSRKKEWLRSLGDGTYTISDIGHYQLQLMSEVGKGGSADSADAVEGTSDE